MANADTPTIDLEALCAVQKRRFGDLCLAYERAWATAGAGFGIGIPPDLSATSRPSAPPNLVRRWAVAEPSSRPLRGHAKRIPRADEAGSHPETAQLAGHPEFMGFVENLVLEIGRCVSPWFGTLPDSFEWVVTHCGPPLVTDLGYWANTAAWSAHLALEAEGVAVDFKPEPKLPKLWTETLVSNLEWQAAAQLGLRVPRDYRPPSAIAGQPFASLSNPFRPILDLWRCGVMLAASFSKSEPAATLFVCAGALSLGVSP